MEILLDLSPFQRFFSLPSEIMLWRFFANFAWPFLGLIFVLGVRDVYLGWIRGKWSESHKYILLAIDIPKGNEQSPKAVENMFTYLGGAHGTQSFFEKWFEGVYQKSFSFEIVSIDGYIQFIVRTPIEFRNLIESAVYSQYPDAEIYEVEDYVNNVPLKVPDEDYDFWGTEFIQGASDVYPIKCYREFEHQMGPSELQFKDPMASLMDLLGSLRQGEQFWFQMVVIPIGFDWIKRAEKEMNKLLGRKPKVKEDLFTKGLSALGEASEAIYPIWGDIDASKKKEEKSKTMMDLSPAEKEKIEAIQIKASKLGFEVKIRVIYMAKKDVMNRAKVVSGFVGYIKQFMSLNLNNLRPELKRVATKVAYFRKEARLIQKKRKLLSAYVGRSDWEGENPGVYNIEELATLWHFPVEMVVRSSMLQKAPGRKADAPASLPLDDDLPGNSGEFLNFISEDKKNNSFLKESDLLDNHENKKPSFVKTENVFEEEENENELDPENFFGINNNDKGGSELPPNLPIV